jgi:hypothetical protein
MAEAGYAGNPRYNVAPAAVGCVLAGVGVAAAVRAVRGRRAAIAARRAGVAGRRDAIAPRQGSRTPGPAWVGAAVTATAAAILIFTASTLVDQVRELDERADRRTDLSALIAAVGGPASVRACAPVRTSQPMSSLVAWQLDVSMGGLSAPARAPAVVLRAPRGYGGEPVAPTAPPSARRVAAAGDWTLLAACAGRRALPRPSGRGDPRHVAR